MRNVRLLTLMSRFVVFFVFVVSVVRALRLDGVAGNGRREDLAGFPPSNETGVWEWVPIANMSCIDGSPTGVYVKRSNVSNANVGIYLNGGGACFNLPTCDTCAKSAKPGAPGLGGIFSDADDRNPFRDFHWIAVPYCTGDVHVGSSEGDVGLKQRRFHGAENLRRVAETTKATFPTPATLVVTGESAGGFGAFAGYDVIRSHWSDDATRGVMLDDSGPVVDDDALAPCLQALWRELWNLNASLPDGCPCIGDAGNLSTAWAFAKEKYANDSFGLISSLKDKVISTFFAYGEDDCKRSIPIGYDKLEGGLQRLSTTVPTYMISGDEHTHTGGKDEFYTRTVNGVALYEWVTQLTRADLPDPASVSPS